jgi:hypothetical protein
MEVVMLIRLSSASLRQQFAGCEPEYIATVCKAQCCNPRTGPPLVPVRQREREFLLGAGAVISGGLIVPFGKRCLFNTESFLCSLHERGKPVGCTISPFILSSTGRVLIVKNRYRRLPCYRDGRRLPAYRAFRDGLVALFGDEEVRRITERLDAGEGDFEVEMDDTIHAEMIASEQIRGAVLH